VRRLSSAAAAVVGFPDFEQFCVAGFLVEHSSFRKSAALPFCHARVAVLSQGEAHNSHTAGRVAVIVEWMDNRPSLVHSG
jgi:hypothetical protein